MKDALDFFAHEHPMVESARTVKFKRSWKNKLYFLGLLLFTVAMIFIGSLILLIPLSFPLNLFIRTEFMQAWRSENPIWDQYLFLFFPLTLSFGGVYLAMFLFTRFVEKRPFKTLGFVDRRKGIKFVRGFILGVASSGLIFLLILLFTPSTLSTEGALISGVAAIPIVLMFMIPWLIQASAEELVFQGWLVPHITKRNGVLIAVLFSAFVFALMHIINPNMGVIVFVNLALYGIFAALWVLYDKSLYGVAAFHFSWNWSLGQLFGYQMLETDPVISIFGMNRQGPDFLTGGPLGSNGSLFETLILLISIGVIVALHFRRKAKESL